MLGWRRCVEERRTARVALAGRQRDVAQRLLFYLREACLGRHLWGLETWLRHAREQRAARGWDDDRERCRDPAQPPPPVPTHARRPGYTVADHGNLNRS